jgi:hypothetical protein
MNVRGLSPKEIGVQDFLDNKTLEDNPFRDNYTKGTEWEVGWKEAKNHYFGETNRKISERLGTFKQTFIVRNTYNRNIYNFANGEWDDWLVTGCFTTFEKASEFYRLDPKDLWLIKVDMELYSTESEERSPLDF